MSYCELPDFFSDTYPIARKEHRCCECTAMILKGEKYGKFTGKWDGRLDTFRQHILCEQACVMIRNEFHDGECISFGALFEYADEHAHPKLTTDVDVMAFRKIIAAIRWRERGEKCLRKT